ncbi:YggS family pyridoxal phosphate enzyme [Kordiimonas sediminis]|uniref:Pyridoxal phosphate homeostasis protein n=1 Tax=Kordiimonas sediminis TaxID=1735581 RepID=A0A919AM10_9PROT|nr:YggS family pyridoxal phosphate-dependent enzyme [Kordiimonas sediminis]GHF15338.1 YggS family pyridoxal phosphate enzyme [Kordiimonas sediminis]
MSQSINDKITTIHDEIASMCKYADVALNTPKLIAVSKVQSDERIEEALAAGLRVFGENRVQEAQEHWLERRKSYPDLELHLIGGLQTNKTADAVALFDSIQTIDRPKLARAIAAEMAKQGRTLSLFIQVNTGEEEQKGGCLPADLDALVTLCREELNLTIDGLMCIPPVDDDPSLHFALLKKLAKRHGIERLSMGMSNDYALAAAMGATDIRVGTALFGERDYSAA